MSQRDMIDRLRGMIREMEQRRPAEEDPFAVPRLPAIPRLGPLASVRDVIPSSSQVEDGEHFRVIHAVFPRANPEELKMPPEDALPALLSLEPRLTGLDGWLYMDIETTGLAGAATVAFLVGFGEWTEGDFHVTQFFLKDRSGEEFLLEEVEKRLSGRRTLVTFNGKAFDVPIMRGRFAINGMRQPELAPAHLDLLSLVRNMGKRPEYGQSLKEAVRRFAGTIRDGDIPGHLIPALYFIYERDGDASILEPVVKHNRLDILDMACLVYVLGQVAAGDLSRGDAHALGGAGKLHLRKGNLDLAKRCLMTALASMPGDCGDAAIQNRLLGHVLRRQGDYCGAAEAFSHVVSSDCAKDEDYLWLARCYELGPRDLPRSCDVISTALSRYEGCDNPPLSLVKRLRRLEKLRSKSRG